MKPSRDYLGTLTLDEFDHWLIVSRTNPDLDIGDERESRAALGFKPEEGTKVRVTMQFEFVSKGLFDTYGNVIANA